VLTGLFDELKLVSKDVLGKPDKSNKEWYKKQCDDRKESIKKMKADQKEEEKKEKELLKKAKSLGIIDE
jgi:hypothetical protein